MCAGLIGWRSLVAAGDAEVIGLYGFGEALDASGAAALGRKQRRGRLLASRLPHAVHSYFRMALDALHTAIMSQRVNWALDADIRSFFDSVDHEWLLRVLAHRCPSLDDLRRFASLRRRDPRNSRRGSAFGWMRNGGHSTAGAP
jgi:hypothetical protein